MKKKKLISLSNSHRKYLLIRVRFHQKTTKSEKRFFCFTVLPICTQAVPAFVSRFFDMCFWALFSGRIFWSFTSFFLISSSKQQDVKVSRQQEKTLWKDWISRWRTGKITVLLKLFNFVLFLSFLVCHCLQSKRLGKWPDSCCEKGLLLFSN